MSGEDDGRNSATAQHVGENADRDEGEQKEQASMRHEHGPMPRENKKQHPLPMMEMPDKTMAIVNKCLRSLSA